MDGNHKAASSSHVHRPFRFRSIQISRVENDGRKESKQRAQTIEDDHRRHTLLGLGGATSAERLLISQPFTATLAVSVRTLIGGTAVRTKHLNFPYFSSSKPLIACRFAPAGRDVYSVAVLSLLEASVGAQSLLPPPLRFHCRGSLLTERELLACARSYQHLAPLEQK